jgi:hypothetical protein
MGLHVPLHRDERMSKRLLLGIAGVAYKGKPVQNHVLNEGDL